MAMSKAMAMVMVAHTALILTEDRHTDKQTNRQTHKARHRVATQLKNVELDQKFPLHFIFEENPIYFLLLFSNLLLIESVITSW